MSREYNESDMQAIAAGVARGDSIESIAALVDRSEKGISEFLRVASNVDSTKKTASHTRFNVLLIIAKQKLQEAANAQKEKIKAADGTAPKQHRARWTDVQDVQLLKLFTTNVCPDEIAAKMNRTVHSILGRLHALEVLSFDKDQGCYYVKIPYYRVVNPKLENKA